MSLAGKYRIVPTSSPWVSEDNNNMEGERRNAHVYAVSFQYAKTLCNSKLLFPTILLGIVVYTLTL